MSGFTLVGQYSTFHIDDTRFNLKTTPEFFNVYRAIFTIIINPCSDPNSKPAVI